MIKALQGFDMVRLVRLDAACFALWLASTAIFLATIFWLPRFDPRSPTGCYLANALLFYVECKPDVWAGDVIEAVSNFAWRLTLYSWRWDAPLLFSDAAKYMSAHAKMFTVSVVAFSLATFLGAVHFIVAVALRRI